ncbi:hypothetical protein Q2T42_25785 [Leptolyngbya boryana CZ1]|uniref:Uncharacterized protein n=1 Tax=Leptolyngbya boryana CZ1 TaxID=3060204 RepID=A0AA97ANV2_LEPBY|nr:hypothetical protein [Leptolyngbya boryana]WNZ45202.1 hypothetical protein Q2T42_25785 [Leptolyngbya boryana CZ1]
MSELFNQIADFYGGDSMLKARFTDLAFLASSLGRALVSGDALEVSHFDGYMNRRKSFEQVSRLDTIVCLARVTALLEAKLKELPTSELEALDRMRQMMLQASEPSK